MVTVIIPVYNVEMYLPLCINSILKQTYQNLEIILIDDGSTDDSPGICDTYALKDNRIKVIHQQNQGAAVARNTGLENATGEYIVFVDSDDFINEKMIEKLYIALKQTDSDLSICNFKYTSENGKEIDLKETDIKNEVLYTEEIIDKLFQNNNCGYIVIWNKMYKKDLWKQIRYPVGVIYEDEAVIHHIFSKCKKVATISDELYYYRQVSGSIMHSERNEKNLDKYLALADRLMFFKNTVNKENIRKLAYQYWYHYLDDYYYFSKRNRNSARLKQMKKTLLSVYPIMVQCGFFTVKDALSIMIFIFLPNVYEKVFYEGDKGLNGTDMDNSDSPQE
ncbi:glycosyltransferase family 2 protein [Lachnospiraceae bacterium HCP28S3_F9]